MPFKVWVDQMMEARTAKITRERNLGIELDPEIMRAFRASTSVSSKWHAFDLTFFEYSEQWKSYSLDEGNGKEKTLQGTDQRG